MEARIAATAHAVLFASTLAAGVLPFVIVAHGAAVALKRRTEKWVELARLWRRR